MARHDYTPEQALELVISRLAQADGDLAREVREAVNAGTDVLETEHLHTRGKSNVRTYRRTAPYSPQQALQVALQALRAHFIEQALFVNSCHNNMAKAAIGVVDSQAPSRGAKKVSLHIEAEGADKAVEIELHTETQILPIEHALERTTQETLQMKRVPTPEIEQELDNLAALGKLVDFAEE